MSQLKKKLRLAVKRESTVKQEDNCQPFTVKQEVCIKEEDTTDQVSQSLSTPSRTRTQSVTKSTHHTPPKPKQGSKNIVKNYGRAMSSFAYSDIATPYLEPLAEEENVDAKGFQAWIQSHKENIDGIERLRNLLIPHKTDDETIVTYKRIFQKLSLIFLKFFCVNWIYSGKLTHKQVHLNFRFKMLRRIKDPENFTYLK